jgi:anti-sigma regulatory factor (Ser/Thr protein kinase)
MSGSPPVFLSRPASRSGTASWPLRSHLELAALTTAVPCARLHTRSIALEWGLPTDQREATELIVSELVTNGLKASEGLASPVVRLWLACDGQWILIQVWDGSHELPERGDAGPDSDSGRGLMIVDALSADWGAYREADGKVVWALAARVSPGVRRP